MWLKDVESTFFPTILGNATFRKTDLYTVPFHRNHQISKHIKLQVNMLLGQ